MLERNMLRDEDVFYLAAEREIQTDENTFLVRWVQSGQRVSGEKAWTPKAFLCASSPLSCPWGCDDASFEFLVARFIFSWEPWTSAVAQ